MKKKLYLIRIWRGVEPKVFGPYAHEKSRVRAAKRLCEDGQNDVIRLNSETLPIVEPFSGKEIFGSINNKP